MIFQILGAFFAVVSLAVVMSVPKKFLFFTGIVGAIGWSIYLICVKMNTTILFASFCAAIVISLLSHTFARIFKTPVTVFLISGITPLVPGTGMYRTVYSMITNDYKMASEYLIYTLQIAGVIAIAILIMDTIFRAFQKRSTK